MHEEWFRIEKLVSAQPVAATVNDGLSRIHLDLFDLIASHSIRDPLSMSQRSGHLSVRYRGLSKDAHLLLWQSLSRLSCLWMTSMHEKPFTGDDMSFGEGMNRACVTRV